MNPMIRATRRSPHARTRRYLPNLEGLEGRQLLATINVTSNTGTGAGTLYDAINQVNAGTYDTINFQLPADGLTINLASPLPGISKPVTIDGYSENTFLGSPSTTPLVSIQTSAPATTTNGLVLQSGSNGSKIAGLNLTGFRQGAAIVVQSNNNQILGNFVGTDTSGAVAGFGNGNRVGISVTGLNNTIGGSDANANVIAFNTGGTGAGGVVITFGTGNTITQNSIFANTAAIILTSNGNNSLAAPVITTALTSGGTTTVQGTFNAPVAGNYRLEFFASVPTDPATPGQAHVFIGSQIVTAVAGINPFNVSLTPSPGVPNGQRVTATMTSLTSADTSALSNDQTVGAPTLSVNPINITYGTPLANSQIVGSATINVGGNLVIVPGTFTYTTDVGKILNAGNNQSVSVTFTPNDTMSYASTTTNAVVNVAKALPVISVQGLTTPYSGPTSTHPATGTASGVLTPPENLTSLLHLSYRDSAGTVSTTAPINVGTYQVLASFDGNTNYQAIALQDTGAQVVITPGGTVFLNLSAPTVVIGTILTTLTGALGSTAGTPSGTVTTELDGVLYSGPLRSDGSFTILIPTANLGPGLYTMYYSFSSTGNFAAAQSATTFAVTLGVASSFNSTRSYSAGSVLPIAIQIVDVRNHALRLRGRVVTADAIAPASDPEAIQAIPAGSPRGGQFASNRNGDRFSYRLKTAGLAPGTYLLYYSVSDDPIEHSLTFVIRGRAAARRQARHSIHRAQAHVRKS